MRVKHGGLPEIAEAFGFPQFHKGQIDFLSP
jgi:hypothetical protein